MLSKGNNNKLFPVKKLHFYYKLSTFELAKKQIGNDV